VARPATIGFVCITALACMALVYLQRMGWMQAAAAAKLVASSGYLATAISVGVLRHPFGRIVFAGLVLSLWGDLFLIGPSQRFFLLGLASFLLAHIAYTTAFVTFGQNRRWVLAAAVPAIVAAVLVGAWLTPYVAPALAVPVRVYTAVITLMVIGVMITSSRS